MRLDPFNKEVQGIYASAAQAVEVYGDDPGAIEPIDICRECWESIFSGDETVMIDHPHYVGPQALFTYQCYDCGSDLIAIDDDTFEGEVCGVCGNEVDEDGDLDEGLCSKCVQSPDRIVAHPCSGINATQAHEHTSPYEDDQGNCIYLTGMNCAYPRWPIRLCACSSCPFGGDFWTSHNTYAITDTRQPPTWAGFSIDPLGKVIWSTDTRTVTFYTTKEAKITLPSDSLPDDLNTYLTELAHLQSDLVLEEALDLLGETPTPRTGSFSAPFVLVSATPDPDVEISTASRWRAMAEEEPIIHLLPDDSCILYCMTLPTLVRFYIDCENGDGDEDAESFKVIVLQHVLKHRGGIKAITRFAILYESLQEDRY